MLRWQMETMGSVRDPQHSGGANPLGRPRTCDCDASFAKSPETSRPSDVYTALAASCPVHLARPSLPGFQSLRLNVQVNTMGILRQTEDCAPTLTNQFLSFTPHTLMTGFILQPIVLPVFSAILFKQA